MTPQRQIKEGVATPTSSFMSKKTWLPNQSIMPIALSNCVDRTLPRKLFMWTIWIIIFLSNRSSRNFKFHQALNLSFLYLLSRATASSSRTTNVFQTSLSKWWMWHHHTHVYTRKFYNIVTYVISFKLAVPIWWF